MTFAPAAVLAGDLTRLHPRTAEHTPLFVRWHSDPDVLHWLHLSEMPLPTIESESARFQNHDRDPFRRTWVIEALDGVPIGSVSLVSIDDVHFRAELAISIGEKEYWGGGYGTDAIRQVLRFAFEDLALNRVYLIADTDNARAIRCYEKCGFTSEGVFRGHRLRYGVPTDMVMMGVLKGDSGWR